MDSKHQSQHQHQTLTDWYTQHAKRECVTREPVLLYSETVAEDAETITDKGYFTVFLKPEETKSGQLEVAVCEETVVYAREENGDPGKVLYSKMEVIGTIG